MAGRYLERKENCLFVLDGDKRGEDSKNKTFAVRQAEDQYRESRQEMDTWMAERLAYLPSHSSPEVWLIGKCRGIEDKTYLASTWQLEEGAVDQALERAAMAESHSEFFELGEQVSMPEDSVKSALMGFLVDSDPTVLGPLSAHIERRLKDSGG